MAISLGSSSVSKLYLGVTEVTKAYLGATEVYNSGGVADIYAANSISPEFVADFANDYYRVASNESTFDSALTFSRSGNATMVDSDGLIKWAPHNFIDESEFDGGTDPFAGNWSLNNTTGGTITATTLPNGLGGVAFEVTDTTGLARIRYNDVTWLKPHTTYTVGFWVDNSASNLNLNIFRLSGFSDVTGTTFINTDQADPVTGYASITFTTGADINGEILLGITLTTSQGAAVTIGGVHIYRSDLGGMVDNPDRGDSYVPTTGSAAYLARRGHHVYNGTSWVNEGILVESESRVNQITQSETFSNWSLGGSSTITTNQATSPSGQNTASKLVESTLNSSFIVYTAEGGLTGAASIFLKAAERSFATVSTRDGNDQYAITVDLTSGQVTQIYNPNSVTRSYFVENYSNGWWRVCIVGPYAQYPFVISPATQGTFSQGAYGAETYQGDGSSGIYIWGAQAEDGASTPSSYIPTGGSTVTRAAETLEIANANYPATNLNNSVQMQCVTDFKSPETFGEAEWLYASSINRFVSNVSGRFYVYWGGGEARSTSTNRGTGLNTPINFAARFNTSSDEQQLAFSGTSYTTTTWGPTAASVSALHINSGEAASTVQLVRLWDEDIGTAGIEEASS